MKVGGRRLRKTFSRKGKCKGEEGQSGIGRNGNGMI